METLETILHAYCFNIRKPEEKAAYASLRRDLSAAGLRCFCTHGSGSHYRPDLAGPVTLETKHLFANQWNTAPIPCAKDKAVAEKGARVFDWAEDYNSQLGAPPDIKRGHWLEQTAEMREIRRNTVVCGYCGAQEPAAKGYVFCPHCLDSVYLKETDLFLLRMRAVDDTSARPPLTQAEAEHLIPLYRKAQVEGSTARGRARAAKVRLDAEADYERAIENAEAKRAGKLWLCDRAPGLLENWIYYVHTGRSCFGWRRAFAPAEADRIRALLTDFPGAYDVKVQS